MFSHSKLQRAQQDYLDDYNILDERQRGEDACHFRNPKIPRVYLILRAIVLLGNLWIGLILHHGLHFSHSWCDVRHTLFFQYLLQDVFRTVLTVLWERNVRMEIEVIEFDIHVDDCTFRLAREPERLGHVEQHRPDLDHKRCLFVQDKLKRDACVLSHENLDKLRKQICGPQTLPCLRLVVFRIAEPE